MASDRPINRILNGVFPRFESLYAKAFRDGVLSGVIVFALVTGWMMLRANETAWKIQPDLPYKTAQIDSKPKIETGPQPGLDDVKNLNALPVAPIEGLYESFEGKSLPIVRLQDDMTPFQAYKKPFQPVAGRPFVSILVVDYGLSGMLSKSILDNFPPEISLVLSPYADEPSKWAASARAYGHEFWVGLPMQTASYGQDDSGPMTILLNAQQEENLKRLFGILGATSGYAGIVTEKNHGFAADAPNAVPLLKQIFGRGLAIAESNPDMAAFGLPMAMQDGYPYVQNNLWLDSDLRPAAIDKQLLALEQMAARNGKAVAFVHPYPSVMGKVLDWVKASESKGIQIAPLSALVSQ